MTAWRFGKPPREPRTYTAADLARLWAAWDAKPKDPVACEQLEDAVEQVAADIGGVGANVLRILITGARRRGLDYEQAVEQGLRYARLEAELEDL